WPASGKRLTTTPSGSRQASNRFWMTTKNTFIRWSRSFRSCSDWLPKSPVTVEPIPDFAKAAATHYVQGTPDGKRSGRVVVAVSNPTKRSLIDDEAVAYHEGVPGHHMQISIAQTLQGLPKFRLHGFYPAYAEGWALYSEELGKEIGFYKDPI